MSHPRGVPRWWLLLGALVLAAAACAPEPSPPSSPDVATARFSGASQYQSCVVTTAGALRCLGAVPGDGSTWGSEWVTPTGLSDAVEVSVGKNENEWNLGGSYPGATGACAVTPAGAVRCWGQATPTDTDAWDSLVPVEITGVSAARTVSVSSGPKGSQHACAATTAGAALCWGANTSGQLGDGTTTSTGLTAVAVTDLGSGVTDVAAAGQYSCALTTAGGVKCWGVLDPGDLSRPAMDFGPTPVDVPGLTSGVTAISAARDHACALLADGTARCWGRNQLGQLGNGTTTDSFPTPAQVAMGTVGGGPLTGVTQIATIAGTNMALTPMSPSGIVYWGGTTSQPSGSCTTPPCPGPLGAVVSFWAVPLNVFGEPDRVVRLSSGQYSSGFGGFAGVFNVITGSGNVYTATAGTEPPIFSVLTPPLSTP